MTSIALRLFSKASPLTIAAVGGILSFASLQADIINQTTGNPGSSVGWNVASQWGNTEVTSANDYQVLASGLTSTAPDAALNGNTWQAQGQVRASANGADVAADSTFNGNRLILPENTRLYIKTTDSKTVTANIVLNGGYIAYIPDARGTASLNGTISFGAANSGAIFAKSNADGTPASALTVHSTITGDASKTLYLTMGGGGGRWVNLTLDGDLSNFFGTIYVGVSSVSTVNGNANSWFSIQSNAVNATLQLDTNSGATATNGFRYNLATDQSFGSLIINNQSYGAGTYTIDDLNGFAGATKFFGSGTITVVPEPSSLALCTVALLGGIAVRFVMRRRRTA